MTGLALGMSVQLWLYTPRYCGRPAATQHHRTDGSRVLRSLNARQG